MMRERLDSLIRNPSPLVEPLCTPKTTWVSPEIEAEVHYISLTEDGLLREPVYKALRLHSAAPPRPRAKPPPAFRCRHREHPPTPARCRVTEQRGAGGLLA